MHVVSLPFNPQPIQLRDLDRPLILIHCEYGPSLGTPKFGSLILLTALVYRRLRKTPRGERYLIPVEKGVIDVAKKARSLIRGLIKIKNSPNE